MEGSAMEGQLVEVLGSFDAIEPEPCVAGFEWGIQESETISEWQQPQMRAR